MITVSRKPLVAELSLLQSVAEKKGTMEILSYLLLEFDGSTLTLTASSLDVTLVSRVEATGEPLTACVPLRPLNQLIKLFESDSVSLDLKSVNGQIARVDVTSGRSRHKLPYESPERFPKTPQISGERLTLNGLVLGEMVRVTSPWILPRRDGVSGNDVKYTGLSIRSNGKRLELMATTMKCAAIATLELSGIEASAIVNQDGLTALAQLGDSIEFASTENHAFFVSKNRTLITRQIEGRFPDVALFIPKFTHNAAVPESVSAAIKRAKVTTGIGNELLKFTLAKDAITVESRDSDTGGSEELIETTSSLNGDSVSYAVLADQMLTALTTSPYGITCEFVDGKQAFAFKPTTKDFELTYLIQPARLDW